MLFCDWKLFPTRAWTPRSTTTATATATAAATATTTTTTTDCSKFFNDYFTTSLA